MKSSEGSSSIKKMLPIVLVGLTLLTSLAMYWVWIDVKKDRFKDLSYTANIINRYYELTFNQRELGLRSVGERLLEMEEATYEEKRDYAKNARTQYTDFLEFGLIDTLGNVLIFTGDRKLEEMPNLANHPSTASSFTKTKRVDGIVIGDVYSPKAFDNWILPIRVAIRNNDGSLKAVMTSAINMDKLYAELHQFSFNTQYCVQLISEEFNTTQLLFPVEKALFADILHKPASVVLSELEYKSIEKTGLTPFTAMNALTKESVLGISTPVNHHNHSVKVFVNQGILVNTFWETSRFVLLAFLLITLFMVFIMNYFTNKELKYINKVEENRDYYTKIIQSTQTIILGTTPQGDCIFINKAGERLGGYKQEELLGKNFWQWLYPDNSYSQIEEALEIFRKGKRLKNHEMMLITKKGEKKLISWNTINFYNKEGKIEEVICFGNDMTDKKEAESHIIEREANLQSLFESTNNIIGLFDVNLNLIEFNESFAEYAKATDNIELYKGIPVLDFMSNEQASIFKINLKRALNGDKFSTTINYPTPEGELHFLLSYNPIVQQEKITGVAMFVQDITELKVTQEQLKTYAEKLESLVDERTAELQSANIKLQENNIELKTQREKLKSTVENLKNTQGQLLHAEKMASLGILVAGVGHEINNPLNFIKGGAGGIDVLLKNFDNAEFSNKITPYTKIINEGVERASLIVKSLRHFSRQGVDMNELCNIKEIVENCLIILHNKTKHHIAIKRDYQATEVCVIGNEGKLHQAFLNILVNAEQAIEGEGAIHISIQKANESIFIRFKDSGCGIEQANLHRISDPFFTTKPPGKGTGLGLSIAYSIIEEHQGSVKVTSEVGKGSEFVIILPVAAMPTKKEKLLNNAN